MQLDAIGVKDRMQRRGDFLEQSMNRETGWGKLTDINDLVNGSVRIVGQIKKEICFHSRYARHLWATTVDAEQIEHLLVNLYISAWQVMPEGCDIYVETDNVRLDERCTQPFHSPPGSYVKISVSARDADMGEAAKQSFFGPFFITKEGGRVRVVGLTSAYEIVTSHGGFINAHNERGRVTTVSFFLPVSRGYDSKQVKHPDRMHKGSERSCIMRHAAALPTNDITI